MTHGASKRGAIAAILVAMMLVSIFVVACGGEEETTTTSAAPTTTTTAAPTTTTAAAPTTTTAAGPKDVVDTAIAAGDFNVLITALQSAGLVRTGYGLKGQDPLTVFAPNDAAFAKIPQETLDALLAKAMSDLQQVLTYHIVEGKIMAADITDGMEVTTLQGEKIKFSVKDGKVMIGDATVIKADVEASNGVIHVIDTVLLPPSLVLE